MPTPEPRFKIGDAVRERFPVTSADGETGTVIESYESGGKYRCVVKCNSGREAVFFENELLLDESSS